MAVDSLDSLQELKTLESERQNHNHFPIFKSRDINLLAKCYAVKVKILMEMGQETKAREFAYS